MRYVLGLLALVGCAAGDTDPRTDDLTIRGEHWRAYIGTIGVVLVDEFIEPPVEMSRGEGEIDGGVWTAVLPVEPGPQRLVAHIQHLAESGVCDGPITWATIVDSSAGEVTLDFDEIDRDGQPCKYW